MAGSRQMVKLQQVLGRIQTTQGTAETTPAGTDLIEALQGMKLGFTPQVAPIDLVGAGFSQNASIVGPSIGDFTLTLPLRTGGVAADFGRFTKLLQMCGMKESVATNVATYTQTSKQSEWKDMTLWGYSGNMDTSMALLRTIFNCMGNAKFTLDFRKDKPYGTVEFTGKGVYSAAASLATQVTITKSTAPIEPIRGMTLVFYGAAFIPLLLEFDLGRTVAVTVDGTKAQGLGLSLVTDGKIKWKAIVYKDDVCLPETDFMAGTTGTISAEWGTTPNKIKLATGTSKAQITEIADGEDQGIETYDIGGVVVDNDFTATVTTG